MVEFFGEIKMYFGLRSVHEFSFDLPKSGGLLSSSLRISRKQNCNGNTFEILSDSSRFMIIVNNIEIVRRYYS